jgi:phage tail-like protein
MNGRPHNLEKDPPHSARFIFEVGSRQIGTFMEVNGLTVEIEVETYAEGGANDHEHKFPGRMKYQNIVLRRGLTDEEALVDWFTEASRNGFREEVDGRIAMVDSTGSVLRTWSFAGAFPVKWSGPQFAASSSDVAVEELEFAHTGFVS